MKFAHIADCHLGAWRQPEMQALNLEAFEKAIDKCIAENVDFVLITGDLFDIALPSVDILKTVASKLRELKEKSIACYIIHGSHDFSVSGKSMIAVLEKAGLCEDIAGKQLKINCGGKSMALFGIAGKKGGLEQNEITSDSFNEIEKGDFSILMLHTTVSELTDMPVAIASLSIKELPNGFDYYALGHIHQTAIFEDEKAVAAYPGALFPTNFSELEKQHSSIFFIVECGKNGRKIAKEDIRRIEEQIKPIVNLAIDASGETILGVKEKILNELKKNRENLKDAVLTLRVSGILDRGKQSDLDFNSIEAEAKNFGACCILKNLSKLESREFELKIDGNVQTMNIDELEKLAVEAAIKENIIGGEKRQLVELLLKHFDLEKAEDEANTVFSERLAKEMIKVLNLDLK